MFKLFQSKKELKDIQQCSWEFEGIHQKMNASKDSLNSPIHLFSLFYGYVYHQCILNSRTLENCALKITKRVDNSYRWSRSTYEDEHDVMIEMNNILVHFRYKFRKEPRWNLRGDNAIHVNEDSFKYLQMYLIDGKQQHDLLNQTTDIHLPLSFKSDISEKLQQEVCEIFSFLEEKRNKSVEIYEKKMAKIEQKKQKEEEKRKSALKKYA